ncbi:glycoside hydrolase family 26 protein [Spirillospora sp. CA-255316]
MPDISRRTIIVGVPATWALMGAKPAWAAERSALVPATGAHFGAYVYAGNDAGVSQPEALEAKIGHRLGINHCFQMAGAPLHKTRCEQDIAAGRIPMISWAAGPQSRLAEILAGAHDTEIETQARELTTLATPILLRFTWEFDLRYTDTALFKDVWRYVHAKFAEAPQVAFVWCPTWRAFRETNKADPFYPGDAYVDWVGADGYARPNPDKPAYDYRAFDLMFDTAHAFATSHGKPFLVGETGVHRAAVDPVQAPWLNATHDVVKSSYPNLKALVYFHRDGPDTDDDWRVTVPEGGPAQQAFTAMATDPYFNPT